MPTDSEHELPPLPPLDPDDDGSGTSDDFGIDLGDGAPGGYDDTVAEDLDVGALLPELGEGDDAADGGADLDVGQLLETTPEDDEDSPDDELGPAGYDPSTSVEPLGEVGLGDDAEGTEEPYADLVSEDLPELDADAEGDLGEDLAVWDGVGLGAESDEALPPWVEPRIEVEWLLDEPVSVLTTTPEGRLAGGHRVWRWAEGEPISLDVDVGAVASVAASTESLFLSTPIGGVSRHRAGETRPIDGWKDHVEPRHRRESRLQLLVVGTSLYGWTDRGLLLTSADEGDHWDRVTCPGPIVGAAAHGDRLLIATRSGPQLEVHARTSDGWRRSLTAEAPIGDLPPFLVAHGDSIVLGVPTKGVTVLAAGGTPRRVAGSATASAAAVTEDGTLYLALSIESENRAEIARTAPARSDEGPLRAERFSSVAADASPDEDGAARTARIETLAADDRAGVLWLAGELGLGRLRIRGSS